MKPGRRKYVLSKYKVFFGKAVNDFEDKIFIEDCNKAASEVTHYVVFQTVS